MHTILIKKTLCISLENHFANGFSFISNLIDTFHTSCSQNKSALKLNFFTDINEYYPGLQELQFNILQYKRQ